MFNNYNIKNDSINKKKKYEINIFDTIYNYIKKKKTRKFYT